MSAVRKKNLKEIHTGWVVAYPSVAWATAPFVAAAFVDAHSPVPSLVEGY